MEKEEPIEVIMQELPEIKKPDYIDTIQNIDGKIFKLQETNLPPHAIPIKEGE